MDGRLPDPSGARDALTEADGVARDVRFPDIPWRFFALNAVLFATLVLSQLVDRPTLTLLGVAIAIFTLNVAGAARTGVVGANSAPAPFAAALGLILGVIVASFIWFEATGDEWTVFLCAGVVAGLMLLGGAVYRRARRVE